MRDPVVDEIADHQIPERPTGTPGGVEVHVYETNETIERSSADRLHHARAEEKNHAFSSAVAHFRAPGEKIVDVLGLDAVAGQKALTSFNGGGMA